MRMVPQRVWSHARERRQVYYERRAGDSASLIEQRVRKSTQLKYLIPPMLTTACPILNHQRQKKMEENGSNILLSPRRPHYLDTVFFPVILRRRITLISAISLRKELKMAYEAASTYTRNSNICGWRACATCYTRSFPYCRYWGKWYMIALIVDFSRFTITRAVQDKSDVSETLRKMILQFESMVGCHREPRTN